MVIVIPLRRFIFAYRQYHNLSRAAWRAAGRIDFRLTHEDIHTLAFFVQQASQGLTPSETATYLVTRRTETIQGPAAAEN